MSVQRPCYDRRRRNGSMPGARLFCASCGFAAVLVNVDGPSDPLADLDLLLASGCTGCPQCPGDLTVVVPAELAAVAGPPNAGLN